jgi:riboflavin kinase/FMN adenylyltransferase
VAIGNFDGVHRGHARLIERLCRHAHRTGGPAVVFTFDPHPVVLLRPDDAPHPLTWTERKAQLLGELGVDVMLAYPTDLDLLQLSAWDFFERIVIRQLNACAIVEGPNFRFGHHREGDTAVLADFCKRAQVDLEIVQPLVDGDEYISSSRVRGWIRSGDIDAATRALTQPYRVRGLVTHGARRGGGLGFPTANVDGIDTLMPGLGVYAGRAVTSDGVWPAAIHIGPNPTFGEQAVKFETHLIGFRGNLYGQPLEVDFLARLRDIHPFGSVEELKRQLAADVASAREIYQRFNSTQS